jgi:hypothetical protein
MGTVGRKSDAIGVYLTGAASEGAAQSDPAACLGGFRSSSLAVLRGAFVDGTPANVYVERATGDNTGIGLLAASGPDEVTWTPPDGTTSTAVEIPNGESRVVGDGDDYLVLTRTSASPMYGDGTIRVLDVFNDAMGFDDVEDAERQAGSVKYRAMMLRAIGLGVIDLWAYVTPLGSACDTDVARLGASGSGTITTTDDTDDWDDDDGYGRSGFAQVRESDGTLREIVYYSARVGGTLTVPAAGRGLLGTSAGAGDVSDTVTPVPGVRVALERAGGTGAVQVIASDTTAPTGLSWTTALDAADAMDDGAYLAVIGSGRNVGLWVERTVVAGSVASPRRPVKVTIGFTAA